MYYTVVICTLVGLQLMSTTRAQPVQSCDDAHTALSNNYQCQEAFQTFDLNTTTTESPLCTRPCQRLVRNLLTNCGSEFEQVGEEIRMICGDRMYNRMACMAAYKRLQNDLDCAEAVEDQSRKACKKPCKDKFEAVVNKCEDMLVSTTRAQPVQSCDDAHTALSNNYQCQEAFQTFSDLNTTTAESPLCTRPCRRLVTKLLTNCGSEFEQVGKEIRMICDDRMACMAAFKQLQNDLDCAEAVEDQSRKACKKPCKDKYEAVVNKCENMEGGSFPTRDEFNMVCGASGMQNIGFAALALLAALTALLQ